MAAESPTRLELEIGHVLFIDIVGYSKLLINEQRALLDALNQIVRSTEEFRRAEAVGKLIKIPAGDGRAVEVKCDRVAAVGHGHVVPRSCLQRWPANGVPPLGEEEVLGDSPELQQRPGLGNACLLPLHCSPPRYPPEIGTGPKAHPAIVAFAAAGNVSRAGPGRIETRDRLPHLVQHFRINRHLEAAERDEEIG